VATVNKMPSLLDFLRLRQFEMHPLRIACGRFFLSPALSILTIEFTLMFGKKRWNAEKTNGLIMNISGTA
jgi:hypothetical protein